MGIAEYFQELVIKLKKGRSLILSLKKLGIGVESRISPRVSSRLKLSGTRAGKCSLDDDDNDDDLKLEI